MSFTKFRTSYVSRFLPRSRKMRAAVGAASAVGMAVATVGFSSLTGAVSPAAAYDCQGMPVCEYLKIEKVDGGYRYDAEMQLYRERDPGNIIYSWSERNPGFTLWHWSTDDVNRNGDLRIHIKITATTNNWGDLNDYDEVLSGYRSWCIKIDEAGAYQSAGCSDHEDARENMG